MNKQKFIDLLTSTETVTETDLSALEQITGAYPFFQSGHTVMAKASRILKSRTSSKKLATAAIYSTNRNLFKKYMAGEIKFIAPQNKPNTHQYTNIDESISTQIPFENDDEQSDLINDLYKNLGEWKSSREQYLKFDEAHPEDIIIEETHLEKDDTVETLKSQIAKEVESESNEVPIDKKNKKSDAEILDDIKIQVAKEALKEEVEALEKELKSKTDKEEKTSATTLEEIGSQNDQDIRDNVESIDTEEKTTEDNSEPQYTSGSVYSFNKPIPEPEGLPDISEEDLLNQLEEGEEDISTTINTVEKNEDSSELQNELEKDTTENTASEENSGSVYSFNKPIPEPEGLPDISEEDLLSQLEEDTIDIVEETSASSNIDLPATTESVLEEGADETSIQQDQLKEAIQEEEKPKPTSESIDNKDDSTPEPEGLPDISEEDLLSQLEEGEEAINTTDVVETNSSSNIDTSIKTENVSEDIINDIGEETNVKPTPELKQDKDSPEIEELDGSNESLISSDELSAIVDQINDEVKQTDSEEDIVVQDLSEDSLLDLESQIKGVGVPTEPDTSDNKTDETSSPPTNEEAVEELEDEDGDGLSQKVNLDDVKKLDPEEVFDADFSSEDIDFSSEEKSETKKETTSKKSFSKADSLDSLPTEEFESFEIEANLDDISIETEAASDNTKSEQTLGSIDKEKSDLRLLPGASKGEKKFRLSVMKRPHNFTKPKKVLNAREAREAKNKEEAKKRALEAEKKEISEPVVTKILSLKKTSLHQILKKPLQNQTKVALSQLKKKQ